MTENEIGTLIVASAFSLHRDLGPGLLESAYEVIFAQELRRHRLDVRRQVPIPISYRGLTLDEGFRADLLVHQKVLVELKAVEKVALVHQKQLRTYLELSGYKLGYLINFGEALLKDGITRCVNGL